MSSPAASDEAPSPPNEPNKPVRRQYSRVPNHLRERIVNAVNNGETKAEVAVRFGYNWSTINAIVRTFEETGRIHLLERGGRRQQRRRIKQPHIDAMLEFLREHPAVTLDEIKANAMERFPDLASVSIPTFSRSLRKIAHVTLTRMTVEHADYNANKMREDGQRFLAELQAEGHVLTDALFFDEAGFNLHTRRRVGQAPQGSRARRNLTLAVAVDRSGVTRHDVVLGGYSTERFVRFLQEDVLTAPAVRGRHRVFVMDTVRSQHSTAVRHAIESEGHILLFLPPYSPLLNLAEFIFSRVKPIVTREELRDRNGLINVIGANIAEITGADCEGYLQEIGGHCTAAALGQPLGRDHDGSATLQIRAVDRFAALLHRLVAHFVQ